MGNCDDYTVNVKNVSSAPPVVSTTKTFRPSCGINDTDIYLMAI